jgi:hypothetical protein
VRQGTKCRRLCVTPRDLGTPTEGKSGTSAAMQKYRHSNFSSNEQNHDGQIREKFGPSMLMHDTYLTVCLWFSINCREAGL